ncbi:MAG: SUMF1/EgtB/PvdO family nonheme iron enzyme [Rhodovulum sp.]
MRALITTVVIAMAALATAPAVAQNLADRNAALFDELRQVRGVRGPALDRIKAIFAGSAVLGQGNPAITRHAISRAECNARTGGNAVARYANARFERICGAKFMAPLYDPATQRPEDATACIDQFEYPNIPCAYPVVWVKAREAAEICAAEGKRLCDAHEWEGACAGALTPPDYRFDLARGLSASAAVKRMRAAHNAKYQGSARWSYGPTFRTGICAQNSAKSPTCPGGGWRNCGSNTYPVGSFPGCISPLGVYDLNGNAAEHMNLPLAADQMASRGSTTLGVTEMKGSWFIWDSYRAHPDWCRWRAPYWHGDRVMSPRSHENYHLGFRCCKTLR